jgi:hypothetical protein
VDATIVELTRQSFAAYASKGGLFVVALLPEAGKERARLGATEPWLSPRPKGAALVHELFGGDTGLGELLLCRGRVVVRWLVSTTGVLSTAVEPDVCRPFTPAGYASEVQRGLALDLPAALARAREWRGTRPASPPPLQGTFSLFREPDSTLTLSGRSIVDRVVQSGFNGVDERTIEGRFTVRKDGDLDVTWSRVTSRQDVSWDHDSHDEEVDWRTRIQVGYPDGRVELRVALGTVERLAPSKRRYR